MEGKKRASRLNGGSEKLEGEGGAGRLVVEGEGSCDRWVRRKARRDHSVGQGSSGLLIRVDEGLIRPSSNASRLLERW